MALLRSALLWASQNARMERLVRSSGTMRPLVSKFMPGEGLEDALGAVRRLYAEGTPAVLTYLGENVHSDAAADASLSEYRRLADALQAAGTDTHLSIKLTQFGWDIDRDRALQRVRQLAEVARTRALILAIDMEASSYVDATLDAYERLAREFDNVAICLQAYLHRTPADVQRLLRAHPYIRLVKGAYREPANVALQSREEVSARYRALARDLLAAVPSGARVVFGTHDLTLVAQIRRDAAERPGAPPAFEIQMLYGIADAERRRLAADGVRTRVLISYGQAWYAWFMRRLAEKPSNLLLVARSFGA